MKVLEYKSLELQCTRRYPIFKGFHTKKYNNILHYALLKVTHPCHNILVALLQFHYYSVSPGFQNGLSNH